MAKKKMPPREVAKSKPSLIQILTFAEVNEQQLCNMLSESVIANRQIKGIKEQQMVYREERKVFEIQNSKLRIQAEFYENKHKVQKYSQKIGEFEKNIMMRIKQVIDETIELSVRETKADEKQKEELIKTAYGIYGIPYVAPKKEDPKKEGN